MTIYWEKCEICGKHKPTTECTARGKRIKVCYTCSTILSSILSCPSQWGVKLVNEQQSKKRLREIEELLKLLE